MKTTLKAANNEIASCCGWPCGLCAKDQDCRKNRYVEGKKCDTYDCTKFATDMARTFAD